MSDNQNNDTNMILSSKLLGAMIQQIKDGLSRISELIAKTSEAVIIISTNQKDHGNILLEIRKDISKLEERLSVLTKDQTQIVVNEIKNNSDQHEIITGKIVEIDNRSKQLLDEKIKIIIGEIGDNSAEHETIIGKVTEIDSKTTDLIKDKNNDIIEEIKSSSKKLEEIVNRIDSVLDKLSIFNNNTFKVFTFITVVVVLIGVFSGLTGIISFFKS